ncbi:MAG TPA: HipA domain-containing protein [Bacteroidales bacterium]|nr:HipA domain-containing protein [Bacteroidales bacterium]
MNKCLYCYENLDKEIDFHPKCAKHFFGSKTAPILNYSLNQINDLAKQVVEQSVSVPGVQAKLSISLIKSITEESNFRLTIVGAMGGNYILKPPSEHFQEMPENEHLTMRIAESFGIKTVPSSLIRLASGELSYITKRIDRTKNGAKIHMLDMLQITESFDKYKSSYEKVGKAINNYSSNIQLDKTLFFELIIFSFITGNNDMHLKNFSMIENYYGWELSPSYDLLNASIVLPEDNEELALSILGKKKKLKLSHFTEFGKGLELNDKQIHSIYSRIKILASKSEKLIEKSFLSEKMKHEYRKLIRSRYAQLKLN